MRLAYGKEWASKLRFVVLVRDPVERAWSDYVYSFRLFAQQHRAGIASARHTPNPDRFHKLVVEHVAAMRKCLERDGAERCAVERHDRLRLHLGMYAPMLRRWFREFPRKQFLLLRSEPYFADVAPTLTRTLEFLGVEQPTAIVWKAMLANISAADSRSAHANESNRTTMRADTASLLRGLYAPFETELAEMLQAQNKTAKL